MTQTTNQELHDALIRHQIGLLRLSSKIRTKIVDLLNATEADIRAEIEKRLTNLANKGGVDITQPYTLKRLKALEAAIAKIRGAAFKEIEAIWLEEFIDLGKEESVFLANAMKTVAPVILELLVPDNQSLINLVRQNPFQGKTLKQWASNMQAKDLDLINTQIRIGLVQGNTASQISRRVLGTQAFKGKDGVTQTTRRNAQAITRTATNFYANMAKKMFYDLNSDIVEEELYVATLDSRTTPICRSLDGKRYPVGKGPRPPMHIGCRSLRVAIIDGEVIGNRPMKPTMEKQLLKEFGADVSKRADLPYGQKGKFDVFARKRTRELVGRVPGTTTYQDWLGRQSAEFQDDVLGKTKGKLFRRGDMSLDKFVDVKGDEYTLAELASRDRKAFKAAGLDPDDY